MWALLLLSGPWLTAQHAVEARLPARLTRTAEGHAWRVVVRSAPRADGHAADPVGDGTLRVHRLVKGGDRELAILRAMLLAWRPSAALAGSPRWQQVAAWPGHGPEGAAYDPTDEWARVAAAVLLGHRAIACRAPARARVVRDQLEERGLPVAALSCPAFEAWAQATRFDGVEIGFAAPSARSAGSLFGHFFLLFSWRDAAGRTPLTRRRVMTYLADADYDGDPFGVVRGLTGGYGARFVEQPFIQTYQSYVFDDGRAIDRWRLTLDAPARRRVLEAAWDARHQRHRYFFFTRNCATLTLRVLNAAQVFDAPVEPRGRVGQAPADVLDALVATGRLVPLPSLVSLDWQARMAQAEQERALGALPDELAAVQSSDPKARMHAYAASQRLEPSPALARFLDASAIIEVRLANGQVTPALLAAQTARSAVPAVVEAQGAAQRRESGREAGVERFGTAATWTGDGIGLRLEGALFDERIGDRRAHGIGAEHALVLMRSASRWHIEDDRPRIRESAVRLLGYRNIEPRLAAASVWPDLGWGWSLDTRTLDDAMAFSGRIGGLLPIAKGTDVARHLLLSLDLEPESTLDGATGVYGAFGLEGRLGDSDALLRSRVEAAPGIDPLTGGRLLRLQASTRGEWTVGRWVRSALRLTAGATLMRGGRLDPTARPQAWLGLSLE